MYIVCYCKWLLWQNKSANKSSRELEQNNLIDIPSAILLHSVRSRVLVSGGGGGGLTSSMSENICLILAPVKTGERRVRISRHSGWRAKKRLRDPILSCLTSHLANRLEKLTKSSTSTVRTSCRSRMSSAG